VPGPKKSIDVVTIGEPLIVLRPPLYHTLEEATTLELLVGGSEANVAIGASRLGLKAAMIGKVVGNAFGRTFVNTIRGFGVDTSGIVWSPKGKTAFMFVELGAEPRRNKTIYDRAGSVTANLKPSEVDWDLIRKSRILHSTGITLSLGPHCAETLAKAIAEAKRGGTLVSFDVNYRSQMWSADRASRAIGEVLGRVDILTITRKDAARLFHITGPPEEVVKALKKRFGNPVVVLSLGELGAVGHDGRIIRSKAYRVNVVNPYGAGDSFVAGLLYGCLNGSLKTGIDYGCAMAALKLTIPNENFPLISRDDVEELLRRADKGSSEYDTPSTSSEIVR